MRPPLLVVCSCVIACAPELAPVGPGVGDPLGSLRIGPTGGGPLLTLAWTAESEQDSSAFGKAVASAGDVNGDGFDDVVVGAELYSFGTQEEGKAYLYLGSSNGLKKVAAWTAEPNVTDAWFGNSVASAGDVNGDGYTDVVIGARRYPTAGSDFDGRVYVYHGSATGLGVTADWIVDSDQLGASFGSSVASAGDVNGDGFSDIIVGAEGYTNVEADEGRTFVYHGSASGLEATPAWTAEPNKSHANFGHAVSGAGDVNGDGFADVIVGANSFVHPETLEGRAYVYLGSASGLEASAVWFTESDVEFAELGRAVASAGDVDGDGFGDVIVGLPSLTDGQFAEGGAWLFRGSPTGPEKDPTWTTSPDQQHSQVGHSVSSAGDVNGDGYGDVLLGASVFDNGSADEGRAYLYLGSAGGLSDHAVVIESNQEDGRLGWSAAGAGDVNGDGFDDILLGSPTVDNGAQPVESFAFTYHGGCPAGVFLPFEDADGDGVPDACDVCPAFDDLLDADLDGVPADCDFCPTAADPKQIDTDGDGTGDACVPPVLSVSSVSVSGGATVEVAGAFPGETITVLFSVGPAEPGPCEPRLAGLCFDLGEDGPLRTWKLTADLTGTASVTRSVPGGVVAGTTVTLQALGTRGAGGVVSSPVEVVVTP